MFNHQHTAILIYVGPLEIFLFVKGWMKIKILFKRKEKKPEKVPHTIDREMMGRICLLWSVFTAHTCVPLN